MRALLVLLLTSTLAAAEDPALQLTAARNLPWRAPTAAERGPTIGLAANPERYLEVLVPQYDPPEDAPPARELPLASHDLLLVTWGTKPSGGYQLAATAVRTEPERVTVILRCVAPDPDQMVTMAITHPATLVPIPKRPELVIRLTGDRPPAGSTDFAASSGGGFTVLDDRPQQ